MTVESVSPKAVADFFEFDRLAPSTTAAYRTKKGQSVGIVQRLLEQEQALDISPKCLKAFKREKKKDDMADALLMALAWQGWQQSAVRETKARF